MASQDRLIVLPDAVVLLDGASGTDGAKDGGWYADQLGAALRHGSPNAPVLPCPTSWPTPSRESPR
jgi:hypothetical protein